MFQVRRISLLLPAVLLVLGLAIPATVQAGTYASCIQCHALPMEQAMGQLAAHGMPYPPSPETACANCHASVPHTGPSYPPGYWKSPLAPTGAAPSVTSQMCYSCHNPQTLIHQVHASDLIPMPLVRASDGTDIIPPTSVLPLRDWYGQPQQDYFSAGVVCTTCHDAHDPSYQVLSGRSFLRIGYDFNREPLCNYCHADGAMTFGDDLVIDTAESSVELLPAQFGGRELWFTVRNRGNDCSAPKLVYVDAEDQFGNSTFVDQVDIPSLCPEEFFPAQAHWSDENWNGPVTFRFTLPQSPLRPVTGPRVVVRSFAGPAAPTNLQASVTLWDRVQLTWNYAFTPGVGFNVYRNGAKVNANPIMVPSFDDIGLAPETPHTYTVEAVYMSGGLPSAMSNRVGAMTPANYVISVPSQQYPTIQSAINAAFPGTSIHVAPGVYTESLFFYGKTQVTVKGVDANACTLQASQVPGVDLAPDGINTLAGFTLKDTELALSNGDVAYGCVVVADPYQAQQSLVFGGGFIAQSVIDTQNGGIEVAPDAHLTVANSILLGWDPIWPTAFYPQPSVLLLNNVFEYDGNWRSFPGQDNLVGNPEFCAGSYFTSSALCRDRGTNLGMMVPGQPDIGVFEYGMPYSPLAPEWLTANREPGSLAMTDIRLWWVDPPGAACQPPQDYRIYRNTVPDFPPSTLLMTVPGFVDSALDIAVPPYQAYYYQVRAVGMNGPDGPLVSAPSNTAFVEAEANSPPVAVSDYASTPEDQTVVVFPEQNDSDPDGDAFFILSNTSPGHGSVWFDGLHGFSYTPAANFSGVDSFSYTIQDAGGASASAVVTVTVTPVNDAPVANADGATTPEDVAVTIPVLANDTDVDGDALTIASFTQGTIGAVAINGSSLTYTPRANENGADSFTYTVADGHGGSATATVSVTVTPVNDAPAASHGSATVEEGGSVAIALAATDIDGDTLSYSVVDAPAHGTLSGSGPGMTYAPAAGFYGADSFTFVANDGHGDSNVARISLTVTPAPRHVTATAGSGGSIAPSGTQTVPHGSVLVFTVNPNAGYHIASVSGCGGTLQDETYTTAAVVADCTVTASFAINRYTLTVAKAGTGGGTVTSTPPGIDCGAVCSADYNHGSPVTLTASPDAASYFAGWSGGGCSGTGTCTVTMDAAKTVTATFTLGSITVTVPNGGESWRKGSTQTIRWTYAGTPGPSVKIELLRGGAVSKTISSSTSSGSNGVGSFSWKIPSNQTAGTDYRIRITSTSRSTYTDTSNANFAITK